MFPSFRLSLLPKKAPRRAVMKWNVGLRAYPGEMVAQKVGKSSVEDSQPGCDSHIVINVNFANTDFSWYSRIQVKSRLLSLSQIPQYSFCPTWFHTTSVIFYILIINELYLKAAHNMVVSFLSNPFMICDIIFVFAEYNKAGNQTITTVMNTFNMHNHIK